jgi:hypothetical protein
MLKGVVWCSFLVVLWMMWLPCVGQGSISNIVDPRLSVERDVKLDSLVMRHIRANKHKDGFDGYRVQLFSGSGTEARQQANDLRIEFLANNPEIPAYLIYQAPNFKVRVGDCRTELEATRLQRELAYSYPGGFVSRDLIKFPKLAVEKTESRPEVVPANRVPKE